MIDALRQMPSTLSINKTGHTNQLDRKLRPEENISSFNETDIASFNWETVSVYKLCVFEQTQKYRLTH